MTYTAAELNQTGIYAIINRYTGKRYIGSAARSFRERWGLHKNQLRGNKHHSIYLQNSWNKHTEFRFEFRILEFVTPELCIQREQWWLDLYGSYLPENGYNICPTAGSSLGRIVSEETKQKLKDRVITEETKQKMSLAKKNNPLYEEHKLMLSLSRRPQGYSFIHRETKEVCIFQNLQEFCRNRNLDVSHMSKVSNDKRKSYKGWVNYTSS
ncbi:GIY-YIG nuclease family protein [Nostoc sp.]|uniref:GIY-YIG nuclease family protein n=1 Tax=Nostoc sp. TaxID=1180 RepID=UPI002FF6C027